MTQTDQPPAKLTNGERKLMTDIHDGLVSRRTSTVNGRPYDFGQWRKRQQRDAPGTDAGRDVTPGVEALLRQGLVRPSTQTRKGRRPAALTRKGRALLDPNGTAQ